MKLVSTNESKKNNKKYKELWSKIRDLICSITKNSDDYGEQYIKIKFNSDDESPANKVIEIHGLIIVGRAVFLVYYKYCPGVFLDECS